MVERAGPRRGEIWWAVSDKRRPVVVVQADFLNRSRSDWILSVPLTTNLSRAEAPGNVRMSKKESGLRRASVASIGQVAPLHRSGFRERVARVRGDVLAEIDRGLRLVLDVG